MLLARHLGKCTAAVNQFQRVSSPRIFANFDLQKRHAHDDSAKPGGFFGPDAARANPDAKFSRWLMFLPAFGTHMCIGAPFGWSAVSAALTREAGFG